MNHIAAGNYYLLYKADGYNNVIEINESNNIVTQAIALVEEGDTITIDALAK